MKTDKSRSVKTDKSRSENRQKMKETEDDPAVVWFAIHDEIAPPRKEMCQIIDYSEGSIGICTNIPLKPGEVIMFINKREELHLPNNGVVMWTMKSQEGFYAGIKFV